MNKRNFIYGLLACSLLLNAFLGGFLVSPRHDNHFHGRFEPPSPLEHMEKATSHLPSEYQGTILKTIADHKIAIDKGMQNMSATLDDIHPVLTAPKFDAAKLKKLHHDLYTYDDGIKDSMLSLLLDIAKILPDQERIAYFNEVRPPHSSQPHPEPGPPGPPEE